MKTMLFTAALLLSGAAVAQNTQTQPQTETEAQTTTTTPDQTQTTTDTTTRATTATKPDGITAEGTDPQGQASAPPGTNVVATPSGGGVVVAPNQGGMFTTQGATKDYPRCSRTVTDNCVQGGPRR